MVQVWQVACGDIGRDYSWLCLEHDLMCVGHGYAGFIDRVRKGDIVILRCGYYVIYIGRVPADSYRYALEFDDIYGWPLEHTRRVVWEHSLKDALDKIHGESPLFGHRIQIPAFTRMNDQNILRKLEHLFPELAERELAPLPPPPSPVISPDRLVSALVERGFDTTVAERVHAAIQRQRHLLDWYKAHGKQSGRATEHEVVAYMIPPLLLALGGTERTLAIEWRQIDVAGFSGSPTTAQNCVLVCEAKREDHGLQNVYGQAARYVRTKGLRACRKILIANGSRFYLYERSDNAPWPDNPLPTGYLNINASRTRHLAPRNADAISTEL